MFLVGLDLRMKGNVDNKTLYGFWGEQRSPTKGVIYNYLERPTVDQRPVVRTAEQRLHHTVDAHIRR